MAASEYVQKARAVEALRSGVPNRDAVAALGSSQTLIEQKFAQQLEAARDDVENNRQTPGLLVAGDFGSGKSHLLEYLQHRALEANFVCSKIVISKETPLYDPTKMYRTAVQTAVVPGKKGFALTEIATALNFGSEGFAALRTWAHQADSNLISYFPATLFLYERETDEAIRDRILSFWSGDPLGVGDVRRWLGDYGEKATYKLERVLAKDLALQRFLFASRLIRAAGYSGWVLLVDEVELIARYSSFNQRARSYAELARWSGHLQDYSLPGLSTVFAITHDFASMVLEGGGRGGRNDEELIPGKLRGKGVDAELLASQAERGMRFISGGATRLSQPSEAMIEGAKERVKGIHAQAYRWEPPALPASQREGSTRMREYVRRWINEWDLLRLYPTYTPETEVSSIEIDYSESPELDEDTGDAGQDRTPREMRERGNDDADPVP